MSIIGDFEKFYTHFEKLRRNADTREAAERLLKNVSGAVGAHPPTEVNLCLVAGPASLPVELNESFKTWAFKGGERLFFNHLRFGKKDTIIVGFYLCKSEVPTIQEIHDKFEVERLTIGYSKVYVETGVREVFKRIDNFEETAAALINEVRTLSLNPKTKEAEVGVLKSVEEWSKISEIEF